MSAATGPAKRGATLEIRDLRVERDGDVIIDGLSLDLAAGERLVLAGPSGSGKSTLLQAIAGLLPVARGVIRINGIDVQRQPAGQRGIGMVFQDAALLPHLCVRDNLTFGLQARGMRRARARQQADAMAELLGIGPLLARAPQALSGGEQQRVALGRALLHEGGLILLDEPLSQLDAPLRARLRDEFLRLQAATGVTMLHVTHDQQEAMALGQRIGILDRGALQQLAPPQTLYREPANTFVARFLGNPGMNLIALDRQQDELLWHGAKVPLPHPASLPASVVLGIRPEDLHVHTAMSAATTESDGWPAQLRRREPLGDRSLCYFDGPAGENLQAWLPIDAPVADASRVRLQPDFSRALLFDAVRGTRIAP
ncbi:MAG: ABC transporter ATP-binding protein [Oceanococcaceae bacterium]